MVGINRVFVPDYIIVEFAEKATRKAHRVEGFWNIYENFKHFLEKEGASLQF